MGEIVPGNPSYTLTELLNAINLMAKAKADAEHATAVFLSLGLHVSDGYVYQNLESEENDNE